MLPTSRNTTVLLLRMMMQGYSISLHKFGFFDRPVIWIHSRTGILNGYFRKFRIRRPYCFKKNPNPSRVLIDHSSIRKYDLPKLCYFLLCICYVKC